MNNTQKLTPGLTKGEIIRIINDYIGVENGYLVGFSYQSHEEFYSVYCNIDDIDVPSIRGTETTKKTFQKILEESNPDYQKKILEGLLKKIPLTKRPERNEMYNEILKMIDNLSKKENNMENDSDQQETLRNFCNKCKNKTKHLLKKKFRTEETDTIYYDYDDHTFPYELDWIDNYQIVQCLGCDSVTFRHTSWFTDDVEDTENLYPERSKDQKILISLDFVPGFLVSIHRETVNAFNCKSYRLCSAGLRALIEGICLDKGISGGNTLDRNGTIKFSTNLVGKIQGLNENGILTSSNVETLHELRFLGNKALHELQIPLKEDLLIAFDIIEHTLENIYGLSHKKQILKEKREACS